MAWWPKVEAWGTLAGHDYTTHQGVREAVDGWAKARGLTVGVLGSSWIVRKSLRAEPWGRERDAIGT